MGVRADQATKEYGKKMTTGKTLFLHIILLLMPLGASASTADGSLSADGDADLRASLLVVGPGPQLYQSLGHCALRLQSSTYQLDYCFTFEADSGEGLLDYARFFAARAQGRWVAVEAKTWLTDYADEHRRVDAYALPLTDDQIRRLWQRLDEAVTSNATNRFDFLTHNCTQGVLQMLQAVGAAVTITEPPQMAQMDNGQMARHDTRRSPWMQFIVITLLGTQADHTWTAAQRAVPERLPLLLTINGQTLKAASVSNTSADTDDAHSTNAPYRHLTSPLTVISLLFIVALFALFADHRGVCRRWTRVFDALLFSVQALLFAFLLWLTEGSGLFSSPDGRNSPNLYLLPLIPIPLLLIALYRLSPRRDRPSVMATTRRAFTVYTLLLVAFIATTPLSSQLDLTHQLVTATLAVRSLSYSTLTHYYIRTT